jgi:hypothetical protein
VRCGVVRLKVDRSWRPGEGALEGTGNWPRPAAGTFGKETQAHTKCPCSAGLGASSAHFFGREHQIGRRGHCTKQAREVAERWRHHEVLAPGRDGVPCARAPSD